jgi:hypothetical protein
MKIPILSNIGDWYRRSSDKRRKMKEQKYEKPETSSVPEDLLNGSIASLSGFQPLSALMSNFTSRYLAIEQMASDSDVSTALDMYADESTSPNEKGQIVWASSDDPETQKRIQDIIDYDLRLQEYGWGHMRILYTHGGFYFPSTEVWRERQQVGGLVRLDNRGERTKYFSWNTRDIKLQNSVVELTLKETGETACFYSLGPDKRSQVESSQLGSMLFLHSTNKGIANKYPPSSYLHVQLKSLSSGLSVYLKNSDGNEIEYGVEVDVPPLEAAYTPTVIDNLMQDSLLLNKLTKSLVIRLVSLEVKTMRKDAAQKALMALKSKMEQDMTLSTTLGSAESTANPQSLENTIYSLTRDGKGAIDIKTLGGDINVRDIADLEYNLNKKLAALAIPKQQMNYSGEGGLGASGTTLTQMSSRFNRRVQRGQVAYLTGVTRGIDIMSERNGNKNDIGKYKLCMNAPLSLLDTFLIDKVQQAIENAKSLLDLCDKLGIGGQDDRVKAVKEITERILPIFTAQMAVMKKVEVKSGTGTEV